MAKLVASLCRSALSAVLLLIGGGDASAHGDHPWEKERAEQVAAARREGIPTTLAELDGPPMTPEQNGATYLDRLAALDKTEPVLPEQAACLEALITLNDVTLEQAVQARAVFETFRERTQLIHQAADATGYYRPSPPSRTPAAIVLDDLPSNQLLRQYARWLLAESGLCLHDGKPAEAIRAAMRIFRLARHAGSIPTTIRYLLGAAIDALAVGDMRRILYRAGRDPAVADGVQRALQMQSTVEPLAPLLGGEAVSQLVTNDSMRRKLDALVHGDTADGFAAKPFAKSGEYRKWTRKFHYPAGPRLAMERYLDMNDAHILAWTRRMSSVVDLPFPEALKGIQEISREADRLTNDPDYMMAATAFTVYLMLPGVKARHVAAAETVQVGAAVVAWMDRHGRLPDTLDECLPDVPLDPFDLKPLRYRRDGASFVVYSVGISGKFDGNPPRNKSAGNEIFSRYPLTQAN